MSIGGRGWALTQYAMVERLNERPVNRGVQAAQGLLRYRIHRLGHPDVELTAHFTRVNMVHFEPPCGGREYHFAALEIFVTRGDASYCYEC